MFYQISSFREEFGWLVKVGLRVMGSIGIIASSVEVVSPT